MRRGVSDYVDRAGASARRGALGLQPVLGVGGRRRRPHHRRRRRQGRRRRVHRRAQRGLGDRARSPLDSVVIDLDLAFGTAGLDYNKDPLQGIANAVFSPDRPDTLFVDRLLAKCTDNLSLLAAPASLERVYDLGADAFDAIFDTLRMTTPCIVLDVPHQWSGWTKRVLVGADDILIVAEPDLANLRNTKNMLTMLKAARPNDRPPLYCLNQVGMPKRPEISAARIRQGDREPADRCHSVRFADVRHGRQQRPDDRGNFRQSPHHQDVPADGAATDRPRRVRKRRGSFLAPLIRKLRSGRGAA